MKVSFVFVVTLVAVASAFAPSSNEARVFKSSRSSSLAVSLQEDDHSSSSLTSDRRGFFANSAAVFCGSLLAVGPAKAEEETGSAPPPSTSPKVLVLGGTGFVGSQVVQSLQDMGVSVVATSTDGRDGTMPLDFTKQDPNTIQQSIKELAKGSTAVISCVGAIGTQNDQAINSGTGLAAIAAKEAGVGRFVYISVAPEVKEFAKDIDFLKGYMAGKSYSQESVIANSKQYTLIEPTFIYGGEDFKINPPRVAGFWGSFVEGVLSSGALRALTNVAPEGFIKIALEPPVSVEAVAKAAVAGALGKSDLAVLDTYDKIKQTAELL